MEGRVLVDRYRLERVIGKGAMGAVWRAEHLALKMPVAVKIIHAEAARNEQAMRRFRREARIAARIRSAHVVQMLDHGDDGERPFIVMEWLEGETLRERLERVGRLDALDTARAVTHACRALGQAHAKGLVHRDIKPENIFAVPGEDGGPDCFKVLDFGVAKVFDDIDATQIHPTRTGALIGTPYYLSPEQARGLKSLDHRADLWSLAVVAFECLTGQRPFSGKALGILVAQIMDAPIPRPTEIAPAAGLPPGVDEWMAQALAREPGERFQSARQLADAFRIAAGAAETAPDDRWSDAGSPGRDPRTQVLEEKQTVRGMPLMDSEDGVRTQPGALAGAHEPAAAERPEAQLPSAALPETLEQRPVAGGYDKTLALPETLQELAGREGSAEAAPTAAPVGAPVGAPADGAHPVASSFSQPQPSGPLVQGPTFSNAGADAVHPYEELRAQSIPPPPTEQEQRRRSRIRALVVLIVAAVALVGAATSWLAWRNVTRQRGVGAGPGSAASPASAPTATAAAAPVAGETLAPGSGEVETGQVPGPTAAASAEPPAPPDAPVDPAPSPAAAKTAPSAAPKPAPAPAPTEPSTTAPSATPPPQSTTTTPAPSSTAGSHRRTL